MQTKVLVSEIAANSFLDSGFENVAEAARTRTARITPIKVLGESERKAGWVAGSSLSLGGGHPGGNTCYEN